MSIQPDMTFHESYGELPMKVLTEIRRSNVSPSDYDHVLAVLGHAWGDADIDWHAVMAEIQAGTVDGSYRWYF